MSLVRQFSVTMIRTHSNHSPLLIGYVASTKHFGGTGG